MEYLSFACDDGDDDDDEDCSRQSLGLWLLLVQSSLFVFHSLDLCNILGRSSARNYFSSM